MLDLDFATDFVVDSQQSSDSQVSIFVSDHKIRVWFLCLFANRRTDYVDGVRSPAAPVTAQTDRIMFWFFVLGKLTQINVPKRATADFSTKTILVTDS